MVGKVVIPELTVNPVTPIEIGLSLLDALYNLPQLIRPKCVAIPGLLLLSFLSILLQLQLFVRLNMQVISPFHQ